MKKSIKLTSVICAMLLLAFSFAACSPQKELAKASRGLSHYSISATLNEDMTLSANEKVEVRNQTDVPLETICFNIYGKAFSEDAKIKPYTDLNAGKCFPTEINYGDCQITSVFLQEKEALFNYVGADNNALEVHLEKVLEPDEKVEIEINFVLSLAECIHRLGYFDGSVNLGNFFPILAVYEKGEYNTTPYYSTGDPFYSLAANFDVEFSFPSKYHISSTGEIKSKTEKDGITKANISSKATRDFAICLTSEAQVVSRKVDKTLVSYVGYDGDENLAEAIDVSVKALEYFSSTFGAYPYAELDIVKAPFLHGGMEYPALVIISDSLEEQSDIDRVIVHEIAHQWWYGVVGNNQITEAWLDESLAEYSSLLFFETYDEFGLSYTELVSEALAGYVIYADILSTFEGKVKTSMLLAVNDYNSEYEYCYMIYVRGILMFDSLREIIGKQNLEKALKKYYKTYKFKVAKTDDFLAIISKVSKKDTDEFLLSWLEGKALVGTI